MCRCVNVSNNAARMPIVHEYSRTPTKYIAKIVPAPKTAVKARARDRVRVAAGNANHTLQSQVQRHFSACPAQPHAQKPMPQSPGCKCTEWIKKPVRVWIARHHHLDGVIHNRRFINLLRVGQPKSHTNQAKDKRRDKNDCKR